MKLQTSCASDKAAHIKVSVKEKVSRKMSISAQREESKKLEGERESEGEYIDRKKRGKINLSLKDHEHKICEA